MIKPSEFKNKMMEAIHSGKGRNLIVKTEHGELLVNDVKLDRGSMGFSFTVKGEPHSIDFEDVIKLEVPS